MEFPALPLSLTPSGSSLEQSVIAQCDIGNDKGRVPVRRQLASGTHAAPSVSIKKKKKARKEEGEGGKKTQKKKTGIKISTREMSSEVEGDEKMKS